MVLWKAKIYSCPSTVREAKPKAFENLRKQDKTDAYQLWEENQPLFSKHLKNLQCNFMKME